MSSIEVQQRVFYSKDWTVSMESQFVSGLLRETIAGTYCEGRVNNGVAIRKVMNEMSEYFNVKFDYTFCYEQLRRLRKRYEAFSRIITTEGVSYSGLDNKILCDPRIWDEICKVERLGLAYRVFGERHYEALRRIFEVKDDSVGYNELPPITQISSSLNSLSLVPSQIPRRQETIYSSFWNEYLGTSSETSDAGTGPTM